MEKTRKIRRWYRLDNAANLYPALRSRKRPGIFRISASLKECVDPPVLQQALDDTLKRIPGFSVKLRAGLFWYYFVHSDEQVLIQPDVINPCTQISGRENMGFLLRVRYHSNRIALELFHSIADGTGAIVFLKTLIARYLNLQGATIPATHGILDCDKPPRVEESTDFFPSFAGGTVMRDRAERRAFQIDGSPLHPKKLKIITGTISVNALKKISKGYGVSITEYLAAVLLHSLDRLQRSQRSLRLQPVAIQLPVNLRQYNKSKTLRNFSSFVRPAIDPRKGSYTFDEVVALVHHFMHLEVTEKNMRARVAGNVRSEQNRFVRMMPLWIKNRVIYLGYKFIGPVSFTSTLSNLGSMEVPQQMQPHVKSFDIILCASSETKVKCAVAGYNGSIRVNFTSVIHETYIERAFFTHLVEQGIPVEIESNQE